MPAHRARRGRDLNEGACAEAPTFASSSDARALAGALVLDGQKSATRDRAWCERGPEHLRLVTADGWFRPSCKRRDCARCWARRSRELARCLVIDARVEMPSTCITLTTADPATEPDVYRRASENVFRRLRRAYGGVRYFGAIEFTTGKAARSGGHRRLHGHYLVKGLPTEDVLAIEQLVRDTWRRSTSARGREAWVVEVAALVSPGAALGYLGLHHRKASQAPPATWRGMTERASQRQHRYWSQPIDELRRQARAELAGEAIAWRHDLPLELAMLEVSAREAPRLIEVWQRPDAIVVEPRGSVERAT